MQKEVREILDQNASFTVSGDKSKGQDLDFILEEKTKQSNNTCQAEPSILMNLGSQFAVI